MGLSAAKADFAKGLASETLVKAPAPPRSRRRDKWTGLPDFRALMDASPRDDVGYLVDCWYTHRFNRRSRRGDVVIARRKRMTRRCALSVFATLAGTRIAAAHAAEGAVILLLPTELYIIGGAGAVLVSFCVLALFHRTADKARSPAIGHAVPRSALRGISLLSFVLLAILTIAGFSGKPDPLVNPLPLAVWTLWW